MKISELSFQDHFNIMELFLYLYILEYPKKAYPIINPSLFRQFQIRTEQLFDTSGYGATLNYYDIAKYAEQLAIKSDQRREAQNKIIELLTDIKSSATQLKKEDVDDLMKEVIYKDPYNKQQLGNVFNHYRKSRKTSENV